MFARQVSLVRLVRSSEAARVQMWIWWLWWQSNTIHSTQHFLVAIASPSVERLCRAIATIVRSYYYQYYFAELLLQLLCGATYTFTIVHILLLCIASITTIVHYYYSCAELLLLLRLYRASTSTLVQSARARCPQLFLADEGLPRQIKSNWRQWTTQQCYWQQCLWKENHHTLQQCLLYTKSGWNMVKLFDLEVKILHFIFP